MALLPAATSKTASDEAAVPPDAVLTSATMIAIANEIATQTARIDKRTYVTTMSFNADINGGAKPIEIIQDDSSRVLLSDVNNALIDAGYRTVYRALEASREGGQDRIKLTIAWD